MSDWDMTKIEHDELLDRLLNMTGYDDERFVENLILTRRSSAIDLIRRFSQLVTSICDHYKGLA